MFKVLIVFFRSTTLFILLVDDAVQVYGKVGELLGRSLGLGQLFGLKPADFGEAIVTAGVVCVFLPLLAVGYGYGDGEARRGSRGLLVLLFLLAFIGVGLDLVHSAVIAIPAPYAAFALGIAEDGGEMLIMSAIVTDVRYLWGRTPRQRHRGSVTGTG
jgi:hypothetical protein